MLGRSLTYVDALAQVKLSLELRSFVCVYSRVVEPITVRRNPSKTFLAVFLLVRNQRHVEKNKLIRLPPLSNEECSLKDKLTLRLER